MELGVLFCDHEEDEIKIIKNKIYGDQDSYVFETEAQELK